MKKKIALGIIIVFLVVAQFFKIDKTNPETDAAMAITAVESVPEEVTAILNIACMDCHSNTTEYPWYSNVAPISWMLANHIEEGRAHLNFSEWGSLTQNDREYLSDDIVDMVAGKEMPMLTYWIIHTEAKLSDEQRTTLVDYFNTLK